LDWYLVPCLVRLRTEFNEMSPNRDKGADGSIGDAAHQSRASDHNPQADGRVLAVDIDSTGPWPGGVTDFNAFNMMVESLRGDSRLEYIIWNRRIASRDQGWTWRTYTGTADPHTGHAHFSARHDHTGNDSTAPWGLTEGNDMLVKKGDSGEEVKFWQMVLNDVDDAKLAVDGDYGTATENAVNASRKSRGQGPNPAVSGWHAFVLLRDMAADRAGATGKTGPAGPAGPQGPQGPAGPKGDPGQGGAFSGTLTVTGGQLDVTA
jgi:hypothetical protein